MAESFSDMSLEPDAHPSDMLRPRSPTAPTLQIVDRDTSFRGRPKTAAERIKHHLSVYERVVSTLHPADMQQMLELTQAILQDAQDLASEAQKLRSSMLASILGLSPKAISPEHLDRIVSALSRRGGESGAPAA